MNYETEIETTVTLMDSLYYCSDALLLNPGCQNEVLMSPHESDIYFAMAPSGGRTQNITNNHCTLAFVLTVSLDL